MELGLRAVADIAQAGSGERWKIEIAVRLWRRVGAPYRWISASLKMGTPVAVRMNVFRFLQPVTAGPPRKAGADAYEYHDHYKSVDVNADYQLRKGLTLYVSASDVFNAAKVTQRYGSTTPDYAKRYLTDHKGVSLSMGLKGTF